MEIPIKRTEIYPEILIDINRINVPDKEVFYHEKDWFSNDLVLFDSTKAREMMQQYDRFEVNFEDNQYFSRLSGERRKHKRLLGQKVEREVNADLWEERAKGDWIANYFYPLDIMHLLKGGSN